jgi:glycosyltransferase involved in cell wall biosynthesis
MLSNRADSVATPLAPRLRVRCGRQYHTPFTVDLGQQNARFIVRPLTPLSRFFRWTDAFALLPEPDYDIVHSNNAVPLLTRRPYIITFEDYLPRVPDDRYIGWLNTWLSRRLLDSRCVALVAMSEYALRQFRWQHRDAAEREMIEAKMHMIYPAVPLRRQTPKRLSDRLRLLFVGRDFMRKGGPALLRAHAQLRKQGVLVETTVVSTLQWSASDYIGPPSREYVRDELRQLDQPGLTHVPTLPNEQVLHLMADADFLVFPTLHETFGYVSLEALSFGTPVLVSDTCAQSEVVEDGRSGYLLPLENDRPVGKWVWTYRNRMPGYLDAYDRAIRDMASAMTNKLMDVWETRSCYEALSLGALDRVRSRFGILAARDQLEKLYELCRRQLLSRG